MHRYHLELSWTLFVCGWMFIYVCVFMCMCDAVSGSERSVSCCRKHWTLYVGHEACHTVHRMLVQHVHAALQVCLAWVKHWSPSNAGDLSSVSTKENFVIVRQKCPVSLQFLLFCHCVVTFDACLMCVCVVTFDACLVCVCVWWHLMHV